MKSMYRVMLPFILLIFYCHLALAKAPANSPLWQFKINAGLWSPADIHGSVMYFGADDGIFYAFDVNTQKTLWTFTSKGLIRSAALLEGNTVYFASDDGNLYALNSKTGKEKWRYFLGEHSRRLPARNGPYDYDYLHSSPVYHKGVIYIGASSGLVHALRADTGKALWTFATKASVRASPLIHKGRLYIGSWDGRLYALKASNGEQLWSFDTGGIIQDTAAVCAGNIYFGSRSTHFYALNSKTGEERWRYTHKNGSWAESSPVCHKKQVIVGSSDAQTLFVFNAKSGNLDWSFKTKGWSWGTPALIDSSIFIGAISASQYTFEGLPIHSGFFALGLKGELLWHYKPEPIELGYLSGGVFNPAIKYKNTLIVMAIDGTISAFAHEGNNI
ncbi:PQQ-like domain-containing protein [Alteromonadaceae bacterium Bs31]|nr:PQQ-like domain-containing protein [Alteromonadaceae bacterium Bs31]